MTMKNIVKAVLEHIKNNNIEPTPENYRRVFCEEARKYGFATEECNKLSKLASKLSNDEKEELKKQNLKDVDDLFDFLVKKLRDKEKDMMISSSQVLTQKTVDKLASLMMISLSPVFENDDINKELNRFTQKITDNPELLSQPEIQKDIQDFIEKKNENDTCAMEEKTSKMSTILEKMNSFVDNTVKKSDTSVLNLSQISNDLKSLEFNDVDKNSFPKFRDQIVTISTTLENEVKDLSVKLQKEQEDVEALNQKIKDLEESLAFAKKQCSLDYLTGVFTRRALDKKLNEFEENYKNNKQDYVIVFIDLDDFKMINDNYGHDAGDFVLTTFANMLKKKADTHYIISRYGGEEFLIVASCDDKQYVSESINSIRQYVEKSSFIYNENKIKVTFSSGVVSRSEEKNLDELVKKADNLLYKAKSTGKNKIICQD